MKLGIFSDLHIDFYRLDQIDILIDNINNTECDYFVNAGDLAENVIERNDFLARLKKPVISVLGNHDFYRSTGGNDMSSITADHYKIVTATLWTNFNNDPQCEFLSQRYINDFRLIKNWSSDQMKAAFNESCLFIEMETPDIVITHFGCHPYSIDSIS